MQNCSIQDPPSQSHALAKPSHKLNKQPKYLIQPQTHFSSPLQIPKKSKMSLLTYPEGQHIWAILGWGMRDVNAKAEGLPHRKHIASSPSQYMEGIHFEHLC